MNAEEYDKAVQRLHDSAAKIVAEKRPAYIAASSDVLRNFKTAADEAGITPLQAWAVHFYKHVSAILAFAKDPNIPQAEAMIGRFSDAHNYLDLGWALATERTQP